MTFNIRKLKILPTQAFLHEWFHYDPETGLFTWKKKTGKEFIGARAGTNAEGAYSIIRVPGFGPIYTHRLAWVFVHGLTIGGAEIDHRDGNPSNNAIGNLRLATRCQQLMNKKSQSNSSSGFKGAFPNPGSKSKPWRSYIQLVGKKQVYLGSFRTAQEAHEAYVRAAVHHFGEFARTA
jgi:hypothetical protein